MSVSLFFVVICFRLPSWQRQCPPSAQPQTPAGLRAAAGQGGGSAATGGGSAVTGGGRVAMGGGRGQTRCATEFTRLATAGLTPCSDGKEVQRRKGGSGWGGKEAAQRRNGGSGGTEWRQRRGGKGAAGERKWQRCDVNVVAVGRFIGLCAGQVIKEASRDIGSDPLLPASRCSVSQEGQTPCRTVT